MSGIERYQNNLELEIARRTSFMNTTKWKYLFDILHSINPKVSVTVKLLLDNSIRKFSSFNTENTNKYIEEYWGVFELREIEWIYIPSEIRMERKNREEELAPKTTFQHIEAIVLALEKGKQFEYETCSAGVKIYGYR